jgi:hypothetical protein
MFQVQQCARWRLAADRTPLLSTLAPSTHRFISALCFSISNSFLSFQFICNLAFGLAIYNAILTASLLLLDLTQIHPLTAPSYDGTDSVPTVPKGHRFVSKIH